MKTQKITTQDLLQMNSLNVSQIEGLDEKQQAYLQKIISKNVRKDLQIAKFSESWETFKNDVNDIKNEMVSMVDNFNNMNRAARRSVSRAYNDAMLCCNEFFQVATDIAKEGVSAVASIPGALAEKAKETIGNVKDAMDAKVAEVNEKIHSFIEKVADKCKEAYAKAKFAIIDFSANKIAALATTMEKVYDHIERKADFLFDQYEGMKNVHKADLEVVTNLNQQISDTASLRTEALKHGSLTLAMKHQATMNSLLLKREFSPAYQRGLRTSRTLESLSIKLGRLAEKEGKVTSFRDKLIDMAENMKIKAASRA